MKVNVPIKIFTCPQWKALPAKQEPTWITHPSRGIIIHHTAGHHQEISRPQDESFEEAAAYCREIQKFHMAQGWLDSGQNFTVMRNGMIFQGRWRTVRSIQQGKMVISAHCPGFNDWIGIEHEHLGEEVMTHDQREASARLQAWIAGQYGLKVVLGADPHSAHFATECPANLKSEIPVMRGMAQQILSDAAKAVGGV